MVAPWIVLAVWGCSSTPTEATFDPNKTLDQAPVDDNPNKFDPNAPDAAPPTTTTKSLCGNSVLDPGETCDDANTASNDGCSATCQIEAGWKCPIVGAGCVANACGDGVRAGDEDCDDANTVDGDGCNSACVLEQGFKCVGTQCSPTTCGDGKKEGTEQCDDGNLRPYDGCSPTCTVEPNCKAGECAAVCGDGIKFPGEDCDDGNMRDGDGCSAKCTKELGYVCSETTSALPDSIDVPIILRDFTPDTSPDFETFLNGVDPGMVKATLAADGEPEFAGPDGHGATNAASFFQWYHDTPNVNQVFFQSLTLTKQSDDSYRYYNGQFYPLDGLGFGNYPGYSHNYHFTSELRQVFTFGGGEKLDFSGDDDVWVFINNKLAVDIGGVHSESADSITLTDDKATTLGLVKGKMYQFVVFQAERHTVDSNYKLTVRGFTKAKTTCAAICGDGVKTKNEACDDGKNTGGYGKCAPGCVLGDRCGDGKLQASEGEQCDDGNLVDGDGCSSKCKTESGNPN